jgi:AcrR family transcriptional regulator
MPRTAHTPTRQRILEITADLFYREGFHATGVDTISERAGVTKMTLYRHFPSKDDLIVAYLQDANTRFWEWFETSIKAKQGSPRKQLIALFEAVARLTAEPDCHGCTFQNTAAEFPALDHPGHRAALAHKQALLERLRDLASQAGARKPEVLADQLFLLMDGAWTAKRMFGTENPARNIAAAAKALLDAHLRPKRKK